MVLGSTGRLSLFLPIVLEPLNAHYCSSVYQSAIQNRKQLWLNKRQIALEPLFEPFDLLTAVYKLETSTTDVQPQLCSPLHRPTPPRPHIRPIAMLATATFGLALLSLPFVALAQTYSATYLPSNAPNQTEVGQTGTNQCGSGNNQNSTCQNVYGTISLQYCAQRNSYAFVQSTP